jgi:hypothetical protein
MHLWLAEHADQSRAFLRKSIFTFTLALTQWFLETGGRCDTQWMPLGCRMVMHSCSCGCGAQARGAEGNIRKKNILAEVL